MAPSPPGRRWRPTNQRKGEFVLLVQGADDDEDARLAEGRRLYAKLAEHLPPSTAAKLAAELSGAPRKALYETAEAKTAGKPRAMRESAPGGVGQAVASAAMQPRKVRAPQGRVPGNAGRREPTESATENIPPNGRLRKSDAW